MTELKDKLRDYLKEALKFPKEIHLESSSRCNSFCLTCPRDRMQRELGEMNRDIFIKAVNETSVYNMNCILFHLNGEPLFLDIDELVWRINYARDMNPNAKQIIMFTNGSLLDEEKTDKLLNSKLDFILISIDGGNKEDYEKVRRGLDWDVLLKNVQYLVRRKKELNSKLFIQTAIIPQKVNEKSVTEYSRIFNEMGCDGVGGSGVNNIGGLIDADNMKLKETQHDDLGNDNLPCYKIFLDLSVMSDGRVCICSQDVTGALIIGDLKTQTLKEIWQGDVMTDIREKFIYGEKSKIPFCGKCDFMRGWVSFDYWKLSQEDWIEAYANAKN